MKARYFLLIFVVNYMVMLIVSGYYELNAISRKAREIQTVMRTASDLSLQQTQMVDGFMGYTSQDKLEILMPDSDGSGFEKVDMFEGTMGLPSEVEGNKEQIFRKLYDNNDMKMLASRLNAMRKPVRYWDQTRTGITWYYLPTISMLGLDVLPPERSIKGIKDKHGKFIGENMANEIFNMYDLDNHKKYSGGQLYFNTPLNLGVTYLNEDFLSTVFVNNVDNLMRLKYDERDLNTESGGNGLLKGSTYAEKFKGDLNQYNPVNNGSFSILRGTQNPDVTSVKSFEGVKPLIVYKVIDMYDPSNDSLLEYMFGGNTGTYSSKADYLKNLDRDYINPATGSQFAKKPIVVAKVTFYLDVVVPYSSFIIRELAGSLDQGANNFLSLKPSGSTGQGGATRMAYTTYFAVTP